MKQKKDIPLLEKMHLVNCPHCGQSVKVYFYGEEARIISCEYHGHKYGHVQQFLYDRHHDKKTYCGKDFLAKAIISEGRCPECLEFKRPTITIQVTPLFSEFTVVQSVAPGG